MSITTITEQFTVVVPAAGIGKRMNSEYPKQYLKINQKCIIEHTIERLLSHPNIDKVVVVLSAHDEMFSTLDAAKLTNVATVIGGSERYDSVLAGLHSLACDDWVLVHDAARPCITHQDINELLLHCINTHSGAILATPVRDTMKRSDSNNKILRTESRESLWHAQTPQMYKCQQLQTAIEQAIVSNVTITDESSAIENAGFASAIVPGREDNIKITRPSDLNLAAFILNQQKEETCV